MNDYMQRLRRSKDEYEHSRAAAHKAGYDICVHWARGEHASYAPLASIVSNNPAESGSGLPPPIIMSDAIVFAGMTVAQHLAASPNPDAFIDGFRLAAHEVHAEVFPGQQHR
ncbi:MAG TPA: hypothetical protein VGM07_12115 [Stellaceae bacterium]|jgi:hypothetical protein